MEGFCQRCSEGLSSREYIGMADSLYLSSLLDTTPKVRGGLAGGSDNVEDDIVRYSYRGKGSGRRRSGVFYTSCDQLEPSANVDWKAEERRTNETMRFPKSVQRRELQ